MDFYDTLFALLEAEVVLPKAITPQDKLNLQNKIELKNQLLKKQKKKLQFDPNTNKAKVVPLTAIDNKADQALARIK